MRGDQWNQGVCVCTRAHAHVCVCVYLCVCVCDFGWLRKWASEWISMNKGFKDVLEQARLLFKAGDLNVWWVDD